MRSRTRKRRPDPSRADWRVASTASPSHARNSRQPNSVSSQVRSPGSAVGWAAVRRTSSSRTESLARRGTEESPRLPGRSLLSWESLQGLGGFESSRLDHGRVRLRVGRTSLWKLGSLEDAKWLQAHHRHISRRLTRSAIPCAGSPLVTKRTDVRLGQTTRLSDDSDCSDKPGGSGTFPARACEA